MSSTAKMYSMHYDNPNKGIDRHSAVYLGEYEVIFQIAEDAWVDDFIGKNVETGQICLIKSTEIKGPGGGIAYEVIDIPTEAIMRMYESL